MPSSRITDVDALFSVYIATDIPWAITRKVVDSLLNGRHNHWGSSLAMVGIANPVASMCFNQCSDFNSLGVAIDFSGDQGGMETRGTVLGADTVDSVALFVGV